MSGQSRRSYAVKCPRELLAVGFDGNATAGMEEEDAPAEAVRGFLQLGEHPAKGLAAVGRIEEHAFLPREFRVEAQVVVTRQREAFPDVAIERSARCVRGNSN